jgi:hypothetical protein
MTTGEVPAQSPPDDVAQLEQEIAATRGRLGDAVEELVAKLDVKSQARAQVTRFSRRLNGRVRRVRNQATAGASRAKGQLTGPAAQAKGRVAGTGGQAKNQRPVQLAAAGGVLAAIAALIAVLVRWRKR